MTRERRISPRFTLHIPVTLIIPEIGIKIQGTTRDIASGGVFFYADAPVSEYEEVKLLLALPCEFRVTSVRVACRAKILRLEHDGSRGKKGIAAAIQGFEFLIENESLQDADVL